MNVFWCSVASWLSHAGSSDVCNKRKRYGDIIRNKTDNEAFLFGIHGRWDGMVSSVLYQRRQRYRGRGMTRQDTPPDAVTLKVGLEEKKSAESESGRKAKTEAKMGMPALNVDIGQTVVKGANLGNQSVRSGPSDGMSVSGIVRTSYRKDELGVGGVGRMHAFGAS